MREKFTNDTIRKLKRGTLVKIKDTVSCADIYKKGGRLFFQDKGKREDDEYLFGIQTEFGLCFTFPASAYELTDAIVPLSLKEREELAAERAQRPEWIKAEKEDTAREQARTLCEDFQIAFLQIQPFQFRLTKDSLKIDIFPQSKKYHDITSNRRGHYRELVSFLVEYFNLARCLFFMFLLY